MADFRRSSMLFYRLTFVKLQMQDVEKLFGRK